MKADFFKIKKDYIKFLIIKLTIITVLVASDVLTKTYFTKNFAEGQTKTVLPGVFSFKYVKNTGASFGIFQNGAFVLAILSVAFLMGLFLYDFIKTENHMLYALSFSFVVGGAVGNLIDRIALGYVVDFIKLEFMNFAIFNLADMFLTIGIVLYAIYIFFFYESEEHKVKFIDRR